ncbi:MAG: carotenoid biosynthesis protein [Gammaproteobacteria bacterium]|nr:carotenoid biosynthesis protein [Gammaproteobacteria bacterium]MBU1656170.1 carotenoid biosynthesis protein [Gammaproteobacteria bacterium]MBU1961303.1 carotenoid biosynthesis protein [Gammaproteobacteria bacterium]
MIRQALQKPINRLILLCFVLFALGALSVLYQAFIVRVIPTYSIQATVAFGTLFCVMHGIRSMGGHRVRDLFILTLAATLGAELFGVLTGLLFGEYQYNGHLGDLFLGLVPYVIPLAWFMMLYPSYIIASRLVETGPGKGNHRGLKVALLGAAIMTTWDLVIDPLMVKIAFWEWETAHYYGTPFTNYIGWYLVSFLVLFGFGIRHPLDAGDYSLISSGRIVTAYYGLVGVSSAIAAGNVGLFEPAILGMAVMAFWVLLGWRKR